VLAEMDQWATDYAIIDGGRVLKSGRVADVGADSTSFKINAAGVSLEQIRAALDAAGISADVNLEHTSLSKLYRSIIQ
jgi:ABC-2 type transport system ATP-binding protein